MSSKMLTIVFSKDRAAQLDLFLWSFLQNFHVGGLCIIYTYSNEEFKKGYELLYHKYIAFSTISWQLQKYSVKEELYTALLRNNDIINLCTDDCVYFRKPFLKIEDIDKILDERTLCFSPRLGLNTIVQDYKTGQLQKPLIQDDLTSYEPNDILH